MEYVVYGAAILIAIYLAIRLCLRHYFPPDT